ncbi:MAG TPA: FmdB family zinc ribbon protein [Solirubrobacteraceae bacterium]|nr:FmdB family zinc ribbon protein [Solirubrobacteraceae bacterium]
MPIYEYRCERGHTFETMQRMSDDPLESCETCDAPVQRVFHPVAVHFKGSGFYNTDYGTRKRSREKAEATKNEGGKSSEKSSDSKTESKPAAKPEAKAASASD